MTQIQEMGWSGQSSLSGLSGRVITFFLNRWVFSCGQIQVSSSHKKFLSHFYLVKKVVQFIQSLGCLVLAVMKQADWLNLYETGLLFLHYKNGSKIFYELFRPISTHMRRPSDLKKNVITLMYMILNFLAQRQDVILVVVL